jgi:hypothetical protein
MDKYIRKRIEDQKLIYHLTALDNLHSIINNGLLSRNSINSFIDIADFDIIELRRKHEFDIKIMHSPNFFI